MCDIQDVERLARTGRRKWRDHVARISNERLPKIVKDKNPNTCRPPGRLPKRWVESWTSASQG